MGARTLLCATVVALCSMALVGDSFAQVRDDKQAAKELYREGTRLYDLNEYGKALESFKKAYLSFEEPTLLFNIAQCQRQLGQKEEAAKSYRSFLRKVPNATNRAEVERLIAKLEEAIEKDRQNNKLPPQGVEPKALDAQASQPDKPAAPPEKVESSPGGSGTTPARRRARPRRARRASRRRSTRSGGCGPSSPS